MSEPDRQIAMDWLAEIQARDEAADFENAQAYAIVVTTEEAGTMTWVHGPVEDQVEALRLAELHQDQLNTGLASGDAPFIAKVYPMNKPEGWDS